MFNKVFNNAQTKKNEIRVRIDYESLSKCVDDLNRYYQGEIGFWMASDEEDYGLDLHCSGYTPNGKVKYGLVEVKGMSYKERDFAENGFLRKIACRRSDKNKSVRYGLTGDTNAAPEDIEADATENPEWTRSSAAFHVLNAADINGCYENAKLAKLRGAEAYTIFMYDGGYFIYTPKDLEKAIVDYLWMFLAHTKKLQDKRKGWELKAVVNLDIPTRRIKIKK